MLKVWWSVWFRPLLIGWSHCVSILALAGAVSGNTPSIRMQLQAKEEQVYDQLERIGHLGVGQKNSILGANPIYRYPE